MTIEQCILERRSTRAFLSDKVERKELEAIVEAGLYAPSALNEQPWLFTVLEDKELLDRLNSAVKSFMAASDIERIRSRAEDNSFCFFYRAPALIIVSCSPAARFPREDAACALQNIFLRAHSLGLGSCWINQLCGDACDNSAVRSLLTEVGIPEDHKVYGCAAVGKIKAFTALKERRGKVVFR